MKIIFCKTQCLHSLSVNAVRIVIFFLFCFICFLGIEYWGHGTRVPELWRYAYFDSLAAVFAYYPMEIQYKAFCMMKRRWQREYALRIFIPSYKTVLIFVVGLSLFELAIVARTTLFANFSWSIIKKTVIAPDSLIVVELLLLFAQFFYALYLMLFVKRKVA